MARPGWAERVGAVKPTGCYVSRDAYGDQDTVICTFGYRWTRGPTRGGQDRHALVMVVDHNMSRHGARRLGLLPGRQAAGQGPRRGGGNPMLLFEEIEPQQARALLESAMKATREPKTPPPVSDSYSAYHAFARARLKALPPGRKRPAPLHIEAPYSRERRAMLAAEFLASDAAEHLSDPSAASRCADHIIDYGCEQDFSRPLRVSPTKCETFLLDWLPRKVMLSPAEQEAMPHVLSAWVRFAAQRTGLPEEGLRATLDAIWEATGQVPRGLPRSDHVRPGPRAAGAAAAGRRPVGAGQAGVRVPVPAGRARRHRARRAQPGRRGRPAGRCWRSTTSRAPPPDTRSTWPGTRRSPRGCGRATRRSSGRPPSGCSTSATTATTCCTCSSRSPSGSATTRRARRRPRRHRRHPRRV